MDDLSSGEWFWDLRNEVEQAAQQHGELVIEHKADQVLIATLSKKVEDLEANNAALRQHIATLEAIVVDLRLEAAINELCREDSDA